MLKSNQLLHLKATRCLIKDFKTSLRLTTRLHLYN